MPQTDLEKALAAGGKEVPQTDLEKALAAGGKEASAPQPRSLVEKAKSLLGFVVGLNNDIQEGGVRAAANAATGAWNWVADIPNQIGLADLATKAGLRMPAKEGGVRPFDATIHPDFLQQPSSKPGVNLGENVMNAELAIGSGMLGEAAAPAIASQIGNPVVASAVQPAISAGVNAFTGGAETGSPMGAVAAGAAPYVVGKAVSGVTNWAKDKEIAAQIFNKIAGVPAGKQGVLVNAEGNASQMPGRAFVRSGASILDADKTKLTKVAAEKALAGKELERVLGADKTLHNISELIDPDLKEVQLALRDAGISDPAQVTSLQFHRFKSALSDHMPASSWNPFHVDPTGKIENLKDIYFGANDALRKIPGVKDLNRRWQEAMLGQKALQSTMAKKLADPKLIKAAKWGLGLAGAGAAEEVIRHNLP